MCNCGKKRTEYSNTNNIHNTAMNTSPATEIKPAVAFQYTGKTALTIIGITTGMRYRFNFSGAVQAVDYRDAAGMTGVPVLRKVKTVNFVK